jgi:peptide/nickel transport system permease protein
VLVERLFSVRGSGELLAEAVFARDYPTVLGLTVLVSALVVMASASSDVIAALLDPRTRDASSDRSSPRAVVARGTG